MSFPLSLEKADTIGVLVLLGLYRPGNSAEKLRGLEWTSALLDILLLSVSGFQFLKFVV